MAKYVNIIKASLGSRTKNLLDFKSDISPFLEKIAENHIDFCEYIFIHRDWFSRGYYADNTRKTYSRDCFTGWCAEEGKVQKTTEAELTKRWKNNLERLFQEKYYPPVKSLFVIDSNIAGDFINILKRNGIEKRMLNLQT